MTDVKITRTCKRGARGGTVITVTVDDLMGNKAVYQATTFHDSIASNTKSLEEQAVKALEAMKS